MSDAGSRNAEAATPRNSRERIEAIIGELAGQVKQATEEIIRIATAEAERRSGDQAEEWKAFALFDTADASVEINRALRALLAGFAWRKIED